MNKENKVRPCPYCLCYSIKAYNYIYNPSSLIPRRMFEVKCKMCDKKCCFFCLCKEELYQVHGDGAHNENCKMYKDFLQITNPDKPCPKAPKCKDLCKPLAYDETSDIFWGDIRD